MAAEKAIQTGDPSELEKLLVGRNVWIEYDADQDKLLPSHVSGPHRVLSFKQFLPAGIVESADGQERMRKKHLVQLYADPPGVLTASVGSIRLKDPGRVNGARARAEREREAAIASEE